MLENKNNTEEDRVTIVEQQLSQAKLIAEEADKKYEEVKVFRNRLNHTSSISIRILFSSKHYYILTIHTVSYKGLMNHTKILYSSLCSQKRAYHFDELFTKLKCQHLFFLRMLAIFTYKYCRDRKKKLGWEKFREAPQLVTPLDHIQQ